MQAHATPLPTTEIWPRKALQTGALMLMGLVAGATLGVWAGYNPASYPAETFVIVHQGAVRGLNTLLPTMGLGAMLLVLALAWRTRRNRAALAYYAVTLVLMVMAALITRLGNQPINALVMDWSPSAIPEGWAELRDRWWLLHILRTAVSIAAMTLLVQAVLRDRPQGTR